ncbi:alanine/glycine:cation symporter family protein [Anaeromicrobium sediminis]|uniref:Sodium:alanine symporter family protein n=1 Tax=Anaeromicrobium sediminis TaxID=1478221 RepID=A0A267MEH5_9FIRM|nr:sodium:alanine symporter family protein [Anaeromicrobium sediminis]PAB57946.1 sodium:alanine symporter family protein [Anaeromicrobium sediminis]
MAQFLDKLVGWLWGTPLILTILFTGIFFTALSGFFQFRFFGHIMKETFGKMLKKDESEDEGILSPFEAVSTAIGGSVGVGNIGGVATAIAVGGPGAVFWMWVTALVGMLIKNVEVTLAVYYRRTDEEGKPYGGPTYYMERGLGEEKGFKAWGILAFIFGAGIFTTFFITLQNYTVSEAVSSTLGVNMIVVSFAFLALTYLCIWGGIPALGRIAGKLVPFMCLFYVCGGIIIILMNISNLGESFGLIFGSAFNGMAAVGGFTGAAFAQVIRMGVARSVYSNEAGWGTSPMIHSTAKTDHPIRQGLWGSFEVFVDTIIVCTITALIIIITGHWSSGVSGATLTLNAFEAGLGYTGRFIVAIGVFLFGLTTASGWYSYYEILLRHLFKDNPSKKNTILKIYKATYAIPGFLLVVMAVTIGLPGKAVWLFADITSAIPTFVNIIVILTLSGTYFKLLKDYKARHLGIGEVDENFKIFYEEKNKNI